MYKVNNAWLCEKINESKWHPNILIELLTWQINFKRKNNLSINYFSQLSRTFLTIFLLSPGHKLKQNICIFK